MNITYTDTRTEIDRQLNPSVAHIADLRSSAILEGLESALQDLASDIEADADLTKPNPLSYQWVRRWGRMLTSAETPIRSPLLPANVYWAVDLDDDGSVVVRMEPNLEDESWTLYIGPNGTPRAFACGERYFRIADL